MKTTPPMPKTLTEPDFKAIADVCFGMAEAALLQLPAHAMLPPCMVLGSIDDGVIAIHDTFLPPLKDAHDKDVLGSMMEAMVHLPGIDFAVLIVESWMLTHPTKHDLTRSLANHPCRQEAVLINMLSRDSQVVMSNPLYRDPLRLERGAVIAPLLGTMVRLKPIMH